MAALPFVYDEMELKILLISDRKKKKWLIPKGWPVKGLTFPQSAAQEAQEEAGVEGIISPQPLSDFGYHKKTTKWQTIPFRVIVYGLLVTEQDAEWKEKDQRDRLWCSLPQAIDKVNEQNLTKVLKTILKNPSLLTLSI